MREALKLTLEALKQIDAAMPFPVAKLAIKKAEEVLAQPQQEQSGFFSREAMKAHSDFHVAQPEQKRPQNCGTGYCSCIECVMEPEPVAWLHRQGNFTEVCMNRLHDDEIDRGWTQEPLYTTPPQRKPLTEEQWEEIAALTGCLRIERRGRAAILRVLRETDYGIKE